MATISSYLFHIHFFLVSSLCFVFAVCLSFYFSFALSEDDAYVDKLPTFERHFDSFAGIVQIPSEGGVLRVPL